MKPVRLSIAGLHSFRERQEIDFTALTQMGMFGIFGPTGSGKSTILDAITLALYGDVGRAGRNTQAILNHAEKRLEVIFEFDIGSSSKRKRYRVERVYKRGNGFSVEHQASRLLQLESIVGSDDYGLVVIADTKSTVNQMIGAILGLEVSDFTRAVVLPQGKFAEFLQLTGSERNAMTERLFGLERYGKSLIDRVSTRYKQVSSEHEIIIAGQSELGDASDAALELSETDVQVAMTQLQSADQAHKIALQKQKESELVYTLMAESNKAQMEQNALANRDKEMHVIRNSLEKSLRASTVWPFVETWREADDAVKHAQEGVVASTSAVQQVKMALAEVEQKQKEAEDTRAAKEPELIQKQGRLLDAKDLEDQLSVSQDDLVKMEKAHSEGLIRMEVTSARRDRALLEVDRLSGERTETETKQIKYTTQPETRQQLGELQKSFELWSERKNAEQRTKRQLDERMGKQREAELAVLREATVLEKLQADQQVLVQHKNVLKSQEPHFPLDDVRTMRTWVDQVQPRVASLSTAERELLEAHEQREKAYLQYQEQVVVMDSQKTITALKEQIWRDMEAEQKLQSALNESLLVSELATHLQNGMPCPVCGSVEHPNLAAMDVSHLPDEGKYWSKEDEARLTSAVEDWRQADAALRQEETVSATLHTTARMRDEQAERAKNNQALALHELMEYWPPQGTKIVDVSVEPQDAKAWEYFLGHFNESLLQAEDALQKWGEKWQTLSERDSDISELIRQAEQNLALVQAGAHTAVQETIDQRHIVHDATVEQQAAVEVMMQWMSRLHLNVDTETGDDVTSVIIRRLQNLAEDDRLASEMQRVLVGVNKYLTQSQTLLKESEVEVQRAELELRETTLRLDQLRVTVTDLKQRLYQITGGSTVVEALTQVEKELLEIRDECDSIKAAMQSMMLEADAASQRAIKAQSELELKKKTDEIALERLTDALARAEFSTVQEVEESILNESERSERTIKWREYEEAVSFWNQRVAELVQQLAGRSMDEEMWTTVNEATLETERLYKEALETSVSKQERHKDIMRRRERWLYLEQHRVEVESMAKRLSALQSVLRGNGFVQYVARDQMERVARQASERLLALTHGRYALTLTEDGSFLMRDDHNGGALRPVSTLSGGETFLTSLSLALALSAHIQLRGQHPLEFFFLDEGFGTLDPDLLEVVISSLEKLHLERLAIGLISHVPELRQRMHRRLIVEPALPAGHGTKVFLEFG